MNKQNERIRLAMLTGSISRQAGGMFSSVRRVSQSLASKSVDVHVLGLADSDTEKDSIEWGSVETIAFDPIGPRAFGYNAGFGKHLKSFDPDIVHVQGIWMFPSLVSLRWFQRSSRPYLISPRGMLDPWAVSNSRWKKRLAGWAFENQHLARASCLHALCDSEVESMRKYGLRNSVCVIPNGVDINDGPVSELSFELKRLINNRKVLLFIGRIHPKKGLSDLIAAWAQLQVSQSRCVEDWVVIVAGWDQVNHKLELQCQIDSSGLTSSIHLIGPAFGELKLALLRAASAFVLPSKSEGLPMSVLEAWAQRLPVAMTTACNLQIGFDRAAGVKLGESVSDIANGIEELLMLSEDEMSSMGMRGRRLVEERFSWNTVAKSFLEVYEWLLCGGDSPSAVIAS